MNNGKLRLINNRKKNPDRKVMREYISLMYGKKLRELFKDFDKKINEVWIDARFTFSDLYTAKHEISSRVPDLSNMLKVVEDEIFSMVDVDDKFVTQAILRKQPGARDGIEISILIAERFEE